MWEWGTPSCASLLYSRMFLGIPWYSFIRSSQDHPEMVAPRFWVIWSYFCYIIHKKISWQPNSFFLCYHLWLLSRTSAALLVLRATLRMHQRFNGITTRMMMLPLPQRPHLLLLTVSRLFFQKMAWQILLLARVGPLGQLAHLLPFSIQRMQWMVRSERL